MVCSLSTYPFGRHTSFFPEVQHNGFGLEVIYEVQTLNLYFEEEAAC